jgi:RecB family exonuclease
MCTTVEKPYTKPSVFLTEDLKSLAGSKSLQLIERKGRENSLEDFLKRVQPFQRQAIAKNREPSTGPLSLSFSQLDKYETCPLAYEFQYELRIPVSEPPHMAMGSAIHTALERYARALQAQQSPTKENLLKFFDEEFENAKKRSPDLSEMHRDQAREKLSAYIDLEGENFVAPLAVEQKFKLNIEDHTLTGKIDRVDRVGEEVRILDYKTGKGKSNDNPEDRRFADKSLQFSIYYLAATEVLHWKVKELVFSYIYENSSLSTTRSPSDIPKIKERILNIASSIQKREFTATPGRHCQWCEFKTICPAAKI